MQKCDETAFVQLIEAMCDVRRRLLQDNSSHDIVGVRWTVDFRCSVRAHVDSVRYFHLGYVVEDNIPIEKETFAGKPTKIVDPEDLRGKQFEIVTKDRRCWGSL